MVSLANTEQYFKKITHSIGLFSPICAVTFLEQFCHLWNKIKRRRERVKSLLSDVKFHLSSYTVFIWDCLFATFQTTLILHLLSSRLGIEKYLICGKKDMLDENV